MCWKDIAKTAKKNNDGIGVPKVNTTKTKEIKAKFLDPSGNFAFL